MKELSLEERKEIALLYKAVKDLMHTNDDTKDTTNSETNIPSI